MPITCKKVRGFLGLANFSRKFIKELSSIAAPLTNLTKEKKPFIWNNLTNESFKKLKELFTTAPILSLPDQERQFVLAANASDIGIGASLSQVDQDGILCPVAYFSKKLIPAKKNYNIYDKELLAIVKSLTHWHCFWRVPNCLY